MINKDRTLNPLADLKEWNNDYLLCINAIENNRINSIQKIVLHIIRACFLDFHSICDVYVSINLKDLNLFKINISTIEGMELIKNSNRISTEFLNFYTSSRRLRNRLDNTF